ncbi:NAD-dependent epimerase/dehydratase family protein [Silvanigrella sp.]|uniref:NAD-dependent epimerase/dehydratase family protein n=1 Tax=Silvanigrella sp. TaxID=2024976 RepID=UPI0037C71345|nr:NAD-dependent epimerase/dehydratase family protein [Silvanigrellaceae bacterium]
MKTVLVTGAAGFIGYHTSIKLLDLGYNVIGIDNINDYYDVNLKKNRLLEIQKNKNISNFKFELCDISEKSNLEKVFNLNKDIKIVINLAAQAGVRYSLINPNAYIKSNLEGFINILECCKNFSIEHLIYASSSSVYGNNQKLPFSEEDSVDNPISLYAASKKSNELMAHSYSHIYSLPTTGLRFFTVYGPWGRPDMAMYLFADAIAHNKPLKLFNNGEMLRDFTFIDDVIESITRLCEYHSPNNSNSKNEKLLSSSNLYSIFNIGNHTPILVKNIVHKIESFFDKKAIIIDEPIQQGDVPATYANVDKLFKAVKFQPSTSIDTGLHQFLSWFVKYKNL